MASVPVNSLQFPVDSLKIHSSDFKKFTFGASSSAFQIEGASKEHGRGDSIWDAFAREKGLVKDKEKGHEGVRHCEKWKDDVMLMKKMGLHAYRFSISWSRIIPKGNKGDPPNKEGIKFYSDLIDELIANKIEPYVTLFHWDLPLALEEKYGGFRSRQIIEDFTYYAGICFKNFGDRVKHWITLNEPWTFSYGGYAIGRFAPGRGFDLGKQTMDLIPPSRCKGSIISETCDSDPIIGDPATEPYIVTHNQLLAHATAVKLYRENYKKNQEGIIGISLVSVWTIALNPEDDEDKKAAQRAIDYMFGWFMDPLKFGHYPEVMTKKVGSRLPNFTVEESEMVKESFDFIGLNYYTTYYITNAPNRDRYLKWYTTDPLFAYSPTRGDKPIGKKAGAAWLYVYPQGLKKLLLYIKNKYDNPLIYITENGFVDKDDPTQSLEKALDDPDRIMYIHDHLLRLKEAIDESEANVKGYFAWSIMDNFEWTDGFEMRFGLYYVDYKDGLFTRHPKLSAKWYTHFLKEKDMK